ncbi:hypothetical protein CRS_47410 [Chryseobacterium sp. ON_d1]|nr:hypothetical protein CRS_47410 [Chryseobacterium sp. ON_d1]
MGRFFNIDPLSEKYAYQSHYNFSENRVVNGRELEGLEWVPSTNGNNITLDYYVKLNNNNNYINKDQMMTLANERRDVLVSNLSGKDSDNRNVKVNVIYSDNATISWDYNSYIDTTGIDYSSLPANEVDMAKLIDQTAAGITDKIGDTKNNRTQINLGNTLFENEVNKFNDPVERKRVAAAGAHEDLHTTGQQHTNRLTDRKSKLYQEQSSDNKNSMNKGYESANTHVTPEQRKQVVDQIINQNQ